MQYLRQNPEQNEIFERVAAVIAATQNLGPEFFDLRVRLMNQEARDVRAEQAARNARPTVRPGRG